MVRLILGAAMFASISLETLNTSPAASARDSATAGSSWVNFQQNPVDAHVTASLFKQKVSSLVGALTKGLKALIMIQGVKDELPGMGYEIGSGECARPAQLVSLTLRFPCGNSACLTLNYRNGHFTR